MTQGMGVDGAGPRDGILLSPVLAIRQGSVAKSRHSAVLPLAAGTTRGAVGKGLSPVRLPILSELLKMRQSRESAQVG